MLQFGSNNCDGKGREDPEIRIPYSVFKVILIGYRFSEQETRKNEGSQTDR